MDAFYPYLTRTNTQPVETPVRLILPVAKYERIHAETSNEKKFRVGWQEPKQRQHQAAEQQSSDQQHPEYPAEPETIEQELHLIPTSHVVTPDAEAHVDADGHLDIYV
jgi:hypothetical protein